jgi:bifunctional DNase/RNase
MIEVRVQSLGLDRTSNTPVVILKEREGNRVLPIWIGPSEASSIAMELAGMKFSRPLTHDLFTSIIGGLGGELRRVLITRVVENTYFAEPLIHRGDEVFSVDARPSDSIAIALRAGAAIFTSDELLDDTPIEIVDTEFEPEEGESPPEDGLRAEELKDYLRRLNPEDFGRFRP